jgi:cbb3-type cytochrome oxidase maturation protein
VSILYMLIPLSLVLVAGAVAAFFWAVDSGQFDELDAAGESVLGDDTAPPAEPGVRQPDRPPA